MKVKELIDELKKMPKNMKVFIKDNEVEGCFVYKDHWIYDEDNPHHEEDVVVITDYYIDSKK